MPSATLFVGVGDLGEVAEQVTALLGRSAAGFKVLLAEPIAATGQ
jgi:hypothetical protein